MKNGNCDTYLNDPVTLIQSFYTEAGLKQHTTA